LRLSAKDLGRLTQRKSATFTRWKSQVQTLQRPQAKLPESRGFLLDLAPLSSDEPPRSPPRPAPHALLRRTFVACPAAQPSRPQAPPEASASQKPEKPARKSKYIPWAELLHRTFGFELVCAKCQAPLRLIALINNQDLAKKILVAMHLPASVPELHPARPPPAAEGEAWDVEDWLN
jgi:hypothetical protein